MEVLRWQKQILIHLELEQSAGTGETCQNQSTRGFSNKGQVLVEIARDTLSFSAMMYAFLLYSNVTRLLDNPYPEVH